MSILVNIISNNTVLQCCLLWIFVSIRRVQLIMCIAVSAPPYLKNMTCSFANSPSKSANYPNPLFRRFPPPPKKFHAPPQKNPPKPRMFQSTPIILKILSLTPSHLLTVTKFLVEIFQFKFLIMTEKNIFIYKCFFSLNI